MQRGSFKIGNVTSEELNAVIVSFPSINIPNRKHALNTSSIGLDRSILFDEGAYENRKISLTIGFKEGKEDVNKRISRLINALDQGRYVDLVVYSDEDYIYQVIRESDSQVSRPSVNSQYREINLELSAAPYKYLANVQKITVQGGNTEITNPTNFEAKPYIKIVGNGNITLTVNGEVFSFTDVNESIELDSSSQNVWHMNGNEAINQNNKMKIGPFPKFNPGKNIIGISTGKAIVTPKWRSI